MLTTIMEIEFYTPDDCFFRNDGILANVNLRPAFNFGKGFLFSGTIKNNDKREIYYYQNSYVVEVEFPTIENEAYIAIESLLMVGMNLTIQNASKVIGEAKLLDFIY